MGFWFQQNLGDFEMKIKNERLSKARNWLSLDTKSNKIGVV